MGLSIANQAALSESFYKEEKLFTVKMSPKGKARTKWEIDEGIAAAPFNKWVCLDIKQESLWKVDTEGFLSMSFKQELCVEVVELSLT